MRAVAASVVLSLAAIAVDAGAAVLYKLTDRAGHVTYADAIPKGFDGAVLELYVAASANSIPPDRIPQVLAAPPSPPVSVAVARASNDEDRVRAARARVEGARLALDEARNNSTAEEWQYFVRNNSSGGGRMPRPEYAARLEQLEAGIREAEEDLRALEREIRLR